MKKKYQYEVAISCAEEDLKVAEKIAAELSNKKISYYLYSEHTADSWGNNIFKISLDKYGEEARFVLMLISSSYVAKYWSQIENQIAGITRRETGAYILPLRLDDTNVNGIGNNVVFVGWKNDPERIAQLLKDKLNEKEDQERPTKEKSSVKNIIKGTYQIINNKKVKNQTNNLK